MGNRAMQIIGRLWNKGYTVRSIFAPKGKGNPLPITVGAERWGKGIELWAYGRRILPALQLLEAKVEAATKGEAK